MHADLVLVCHASTAAVRSASFPNDEPLDERGAADAAAAAASLARPDRAWCAPSVAARQTAAALGLAASVEPALRDGDVGRWAGRAVAEVARDEPAAFATWRTDPRSSPSGAEPLVALLERVGGWLDGCIGEPGRTVAVTHTAVIRAAIVWAIEAAPATFWHVDIGPLSRTHLRSDGRRWALRSLVG
jgi:broad specificity phosphatase PhoE